MTVKKLRSILRTLTSNKYYINVINGNLIIRANNRDYWFSSEGSTDVLPFKLYRNVYYKIDISNLFPAEWKMLNSKDKEMMNLGLKLIIQNSYNKE